MVKMWYECMDDPNQSKDNTTLFVHHEKLKQGFL